MLETSGNMGYILDDQGFLQLCVLFMEVVPFTHHSSAVSRDSVARPQVHVLISVLQS